MFDRLYECATQTATDNGQVFLVVCPQARWEGIWSPAESSSFQQAQDEHRAAHRDQDERQERGFHRRNALHVYRTTEPGNPARRGIGAYL